MLDLKLTQLGLKMKNLVVVDVSFPVHPFVEFKKAYDTRLIHLPCREEMAVAYAAGLAGMGKVVLVVGVTRGGATGLESTLNVKLVKESPEARWEDLEGQIRSFGPGYVFVPLSLIPPSSSSNL